MSLLSGARHAAAGATCYILNKGLHYEEEKNANIKSRVLKYGAKLQLNQLNSTQAVPATLV